MATASVPRTTRSLRDLRAQIDKLDMQILKLLNDRAVAAAQIGQLKTDANEDVLSLAREEEVLQNVLAANEKLKGLLTADVVRNVYREIISGARSLQKVLRVAYLGPDASYSHLAAIERFGRTVEYHPVSTISAVFEEVDRGHDDFGVVPIENSTDGRVTDTLEMFTRMPHLIIQAEVRLEIHHNLLAKCEPNQIRMVYSKGQVLSQCRNWLAKNLPQAKTHVMHSTTAAAELASQSESDAAIASRQAAARYGLRVLYANIEDEPDNETRFVVIGKQKSSRTGHDKTAVMFRLPHNPGSLVESLDIFKQNKINLTWIESFPARGAKNEYLFFIDFEGHQEDAKVARALKALKEHCDELTVLGSFPFAEPASL
jgi:chorismate mutase/prephenate dehydratase